MKSEKRNDFILENKNVLLFASIIIRTRPKETGLYPEKYIKTIDNEKIKSNIEKYTFLDEIATNILYSCGREYDDEHSRYNYYTVNGDKREKLKIKIQEWKKIVRALNKIK